MWLKGNIKITKMATVLTSSTPDSSKMSSGKKGLFKNIASLGLVQVANYALPLVSIPIISRIVGPDKLGVINYAVAFIAYFNVFIGYGFDFTATRRVSKDPGNIDLRVAVFNEVFFAKFLLFSISLILFIVCLFIVPPLAREKEVAVFTFLICLGPWIAQNWVFQAMQELPKIAWMNFICKLLFTVSILLFIKQKEDYVLQPLLTGLMHIIIAGFSFWWAFQRYKLKFVFVPFQRILNLLWEEKTVFLSLIAMNLYTTTNTVMLGIMEPDDQVGYYTAAQRLMSVVTGIINMPLAQAFYPFIGMAFNESFEKGLVTIQKFLPIILSFTLLTSISIFLMGPTVVYWFYGDKFNQSVNALRIISFIPFIVAMSNMFGVQIMLNLKLDKLYFRITAGGAVLGLTLNYFMISYLGFVGTAWNWLIVETYILITMYVALRIKGINPIDMHQFTPATIGNQIKLLTGKFKK